MKRFATVFAALFLCLGLAHAQDVYFSGNSNGTGKIWKNNTLVYSIADTTHQVCLSSFQMASDSSIYSAGYVHDSAYDFVQGRIWLNDSIVFAADTNTAINSMMLNGNGWTATGIGENEWDRVAGLVWQNGSLLYAYTDSIIDNQIRALTIDTLTGDIYMGGVSSELEYKATIWKNDTLLWRDDSVSDIYSIAFDGADLYAAGCRYVGDTSTSATLWQNGSIVFCINDDNSASEFQVVSFYNENGSIYLGGYIGNTLYIWQDDEVLYEHPYLESAKINALVANEWGVHYAGQIDGVATVWKDGEILYQPENCDDITGLAVRPTPPQTTFTLTVEPDSTGWGTVTGGGAYPLGDTATIQAFPNIGCAFLYWNDSITDNPLNVIITQDSTFVAHFGLIDYNITTSVEPENAGTVTEGGIYHYGDTLTLEATPNAGFVFEMWNDSVTDNPRDIIVTQDSTFIAQFNLIDYNITTSVEPENSGTVTEGGVYHYGDTLTLEATPNAGFAFEMWNDSVTDNPRDIIVTQDSNFIARFSVMEYLIEVHVVPEGTGFVTGGGTYPYGDTIQLEATPNMGYEFMTWDDGNTDNPRSVVVTESQSFIATFGLRQCVVDVEATPFEGGIVIGGGTYSYGDTILLVAQNNTGYTFKTWSDDVLDNPRQIVVEGDVTYTAIFSALQFEITTGAEPEDGGTVDGGGTYLYGETAVIYARPFNDYSFICWSDGIVSNPRHITVTQNATYKALFRHNETPVHEYSIKVIPNNPDWGTVSGNGIYPEGSTIEIGATPNENYQFMGWDDGNTDNPRSVTVTSDMIFTAIFEAIPKYTITVRSISTSMGTVYGSGTYFANTVINIGAIAEQGYYFTGWQDEDMNNPRTITVTEDAEYTAYFSRTPTPTFTVTVYYDESQGIILGSGTYAAGSTATLVAIPADDYMFVKWSDGITDNRREVLVDHDIVLAAFFNGTDVDENGYETVSLYPNPTNGIMRLEGLEGQHEIQIYNIYGMCLKTASINGDSEIDLDDLSAGIYFLRIDGHTMKFVKE